MKNKISSVAVIGAGSWGTSLAVLLSNKGIPVRLWAHKQSHVEELSHKRENNKYLAGIILPKSLEPTASLRGAVEGAELVLMVVPSHGYRDVFSQLIPFLAEGAKVISAVKGVENNSLSTMHQIMVEELGSKTSTVELGVLSGPSFAKEVALNKPTAVTIGFDNIETAQWAQDIFSTDFFRVYTSTDVDGLELSGAFKNIIAIATGICDGLDFGLNTRAALITRGLAEMQRLGVAMKADSATFSGLSGLGDLLLTCTGDLSRNRKVGLELGRGNTIEKIEQEMFMVAEGVKTTLSMYQLARKWNIDTPILDEVYNIIYQGKDCLQAVQDLLARELKPE